MPNALRDFLYPYSVAVIGASKEPTKRGFRAIQTLLTEQFSGMIFPINPKVEDILGLTAYSKLSAVPHHIDLALICTPASTVPSVLRECGEKGIKGAVILAGGFSEAGAAGKHLEDEAVSVAREYGVRLIGPNTSGMFNTHRACNLVGFADLPKGAIGILSQSGNMALSLVTEGQINGHVGFSTYIGVGNEADIQFHDYLEYFADDENTHVLIIYAEGFKQGRAFLETAQRVTRKVPVVLYKSGRTAVGQSAAKSHTGTLAGSYEVSRDVLRQAGVTLVQRADQMLPIAETLALLPPPQSKRIAILADGGGHATIAADALTESGFSLVPLSTATQARLAALLPPAAALHNPVDVAGGTDVNPELFADCARAILHDENIDALLIVGLFGGYKLRFSQTLELLENQTAARLGSLVEEFGKPVILQSLYQPLRPDALIMLRQAGVPVHSSIETAVQCFAALAEYGATKRRNAVTERIAALAPVAEAAAIVQRCRREGRASLLEHEAKALLQHYGVTIPSNVLVEDAADLGRVYRQLGDVPLAMKVVSPDILHKSDAGGVRLNVMGEKELQQAYTAIVANALAFNPQADIRGVLVSPMAQPGVEIIIGVIVDPQFGPIMMVGLGGIFVEVLKDVVFRALPLTAIDAADLLEGIKAKALLNGIRGMLPVNKAALQALLVRISQICLAHPELTELDLNPIIANAEGYTVVDARMIL